DNGVRKLWPKQSWSWARRQGTERVRKVTSAYWSVFGRQYMRVHPSMTSLDAIFSGTNTRRTQPSDGAIGLRVTIHSPDGRLLFKGEHYDPTTPAASMPIRVSATPVDGGPEREQTAVMRVWVKGDPYLASAEIPDTEWTGPQLPDEGWYQWEVTSAGADAMDEDLVAYAINGNGNRLEPAFEPVYGYYDEGLGLHYVIWNEIGQPREPQVYTDTGDDIAAYALQFLDLEAINFEKHCDETQADRSYSPKLSGSMTPNRSMLGPQVSQHPDNLDALHARARPKVAGLHGNQPTLSAGDNIHLWATRSTHWKHLDSVNAKNGYQDLETRGVRLDTGESSTLWVRMTLAMVYLDDQPIRRGLESIADNEGLIRGGKWTLRATLEQLLGGSTGWSNATQHAQTSEQMTLKGDFWPHWPTTFRDHTPFLQQAYFSYFEETSDRYTRTFREGHLFEEQTEDGGLVVPWRLSLDLSSIDLQADQRDKPHRLRLDAKFDDHENGTNVDNYRMYLVDLMVEDESDIDLV
ncbi:MAG: hypothetical protein ABEK29_08560, partial [Bradymonadaceae bacterium]